MPDGEPQSDFIPIAVVVVEHEGKVLIGQRGPAKPLAGYWEFPGGKVRPGEDPAVAAARECVEETGQAIRVVRLEQEVLYKYPHAGLRIFFFAAVPEDPLVRPHAPFIWVPGAGLTGYAFPPANKPVLTKLLRRFSKS
jgi:8-oxo-dGTP diphosphatase